MIKRIFLFFVLFLFLTFGKPVESKELSSNKVEKYIDKISNKFTRTYCNTRQFGISKDGALAFAIGETNQEFKKNKLNSLIDHKLLNDRIINSLESNCQVYNFPIDILDELEFE